MIHRPQVSPKLYINLSLMLTVSCICIKPGSSLIKTNFFFHTESNIIFKEKEDEDWVMHVFLFNHLKGRNSFSAADPEELHSFSHVFRTSLSNSWAERHMWLSVVERPDHSRFTRVQRASCCVALLYFYMFVSAVWYGLLKDQKEAALPFSWQVFGWEDLIIALVSVTITFPIGLGLIFIFKKSKLQVCLSK